MATWETKIDVLDFDNKTIRVTGTRTDGDNVGVFSCEGTYNKKKVLSYADVLWNEYQRAKATVTKVDAIKTEAEEVITAVLDAKEA